MAISNDETGEGLTKVGDLVGPIRHFKDVLRFNVSVNDVAGVHVGHSSQQLPHAASCIGLPHTARVLLELTKQLTLLRLLCESRKGGHDCAVRLVHALVVKKCEDSEKRGAT